ncbi:SIS domain-containing protein [Variovorax beijingensis]|uniref:SIS domain-containing protein n=1 Tax=Variovorax beijingensis TaxID=2496117 RepID=A0A3P3EL79_9BURK|nr:SIS domain-containing protein [Variovorax beijingensis]RRH87017.1 SIS domain-containing protein [Variovorax beijingensis]
MPSFFPDHQIPDAGLYADAYFERITAAAKTVNRSALAAAGRLLAERAAQGKMIFSCGNGGSAAISNHLICDCMKGVRSNGWLKPKVNSLSSAVELITAIVNDIGPEEMFSFQLTSMASEGDVLIAISSSGASPNIIKALNTAREMKMATIAMTGFSGGDSVRLADVSLHVDAENYGVVEDVHQSLMHILAQYLRQSHLTDPSLLGTLKF